MFFLGSQQTNNNLPTFDDIDAEDCSKFFKSELRDWSNENLINAIRDRFVTGNWSKAALRGHELNGNGEDDEGVYGDFEDLETGEVHRSQASENSEGNSGAHKEDDPEAEDRRIKKLALREKFDAQYP
jgi:ribosome biogenesis protein BMS1